MKFLMHSYRSFSITLSLFIIALAFAAVSDVSLWSFCIPAMFFLGAVMYGLGSIRTWRCGSRIKSLLEGIVAVGMWAAFMVSMAVFGGVL